VKKLLLTGALMAVAACRGSVSDQPPIHIIPDMDWQDKYHPQGESAFFPDGRAMRPRVEGTVAAGGLKEDSVYFKGKQGDAFVARMPTEKVKAALGVDSLEAVMSRGQQRFNIYCTPCHDATGSGNGLVIQRALAAPPSGFARPPHLAENAATLPDGQIFDYITNGVRSMPAYGHQIPEADRWAIVSWLRVLQRSQRANLSDVPEQFKNSIEAEDAQ